MELFPMVFTSVCSMHRFKQVSGFVKFAQLHDCAPVFVRKAKKINWITVQTITLLHAQLTSLHSQNMSSHWGFSLWLGPEEDALWINNQLFCKWKPLHTLLMTSGQDLFKQAGGSDTLISTARSISTVRHPVWDSGRVSCSWQKRKHPLCRPWT